MEPQEAVIQRILELCIQRNMSIHKLAEHSAVPPSTLKNIMNGRSRNIGIVTIAKLCFGLNITLKDFFATEYMTDVETEI